MERGRPWLRMKVGDLARRPHRAGRRRQPVDHRRGARADGHAWRKRAGALLTGVGTVRDDDPRLDVRLVRDRAPAAALRGRFAPETPPEARIFAPPAPVLLYAAVRRRRAPGRAAKRAAPRSSTCRRATARLDLAAMLADLGRRGINELHVEAGDKLNGALLRNRPRRRAAGLPGAHAARQRPRHGRRSARCASLAQALAFEFHAAAKVGADLRILRTNRRVT